MYRRIVVACVVLTLGLVMLGAYVRLSDAGLGCPDWPGCYGQLSPHHAQEEISSAVTQQGGEAGPVSMAKAWKEMVHRYIASFLGLVIVGLAWAAWRKPRERRAGLATLLVLVVCLQGAFGAWTVTLLLKPAIVTGHLLGGMAVLGLLTTLALTQYPLPGYRHRPVSRSLKGLSLLALLLVIVQISLGGWVSTNYAALACPDFPTCHQQWVPEASWEHAFHIVRELGMTPDGMLLPQAALVAIHFVHRVGALVVTLVLLMYAGVLARAGWRGLGALVVMVLALQVSLGIATVLLGFPLALAVAHNGGAALLLITLIVARMRLLQAAP